MGHNLIATHVGIFTVEKGKGYCLLEYRVYGELKLSWLETWKSLQIMENDDDLCIVDYLSLQLDDYPTILFYPAGDKANPVIILRSVRNSFILFYI